MASPGYLARRGSPESVEALAGHRCLTLHTADLPQTEWALLVEGERRVLPVHSPLCGDGNLARRWALSGMGVALKSLFDVIDELESGQLVRVLPRVTGGMGAIQAVFPSRRFQPTRVRALTEAISGVFAERGARCQAWLDANSPSQG